MWGNIIDWGSAPAWAALAAALYAGYTAKKNLDNASTQLRVANTQLAIAQRARDLELEQNRRRSAAQVEVWVDRDWDEDDKERLMVMGWNRGYLSVYGLLAKVHTYDVNSRPDLVVENVPLLPPSTQPRILLNFTDTWDDDRAEMNRFRLQAYYTHQVLVTIKFRDSEGIYWLRDHLGKLHEIG